MTHPIALKTLLKATSQELIDLQHIAEGLQSVVSTGNAPSNETLQLIQKLDYLTQSLGALSEFWMTTENNLSNDWVVDCDDAIQAVRLKDLAASLSGQANLINDNSDQGVLEEF